MQLSDGERLIVLMLADIMKTQNINGVIDPSLISTLATDGDDWAIKHHYPNIFSGGQQTDLVVSDTNKFLNMWEKF
ncbi:MAG: hypothetical protein ACI9RO_001085 [Alteromonas macleodii]|mgnify:CR=1 FL=1|jgi:hypothetical protein